MSERQENIRPEPTSGWDKRVVVIVILSLLGAWISLSLTKYRLSGGQGESAVFRTVCEMTGNGCGQVLKSAWSMLPRQIPTAFLGLVYFSAITLWYLVVGRPDRAGRAWFLPIFALQLLSAVFSLFLLGVMLVQLREFCGWCVITHLLNFILLGLAWKLWPRRLGESARPYARLGFAALLLVLVVTAFWERWIMTQYLSAEAAHFRSDTDLMRYLHVRNPPKAIPLRADDPILGNSAAPHTIVVFSDFQCPSCRNFSAFFKSQIQPLYGDRVRLAFKHLPLESECNPTLQRVVHPQACEAAYAAEAARELEGSEGFWKLHDALFEHQAQVAEGRWAELASSVGLDGAAIADRVKQRKHLNRISQDVEQAIDLKLPGTPAIFIDGRALEEWTNPELWKAILGAPGNTPQTAAAATR
jgi:protein-disulfide isomerase/uncharacterized membrane protein